MGEAIVTRSGWHYAIVETEVIDDEALTPWAKLVYMALARHVDGSGRCFPGVPRLARLAGCSENSVRGAIKLLASEGWLVVTRRPAANGGNQTNEYHLTGRKNAPCEGGMVHQVKGGTSPGEGELKPFNELSLDGGSSPEKVGKKPAKTAVPDSYRIVEDAYFDTATRLVDVGRLQCLPVYDYAKGRGLIGRRLKAYDAATLARAVRAAADDDWLVGRGFPLSLILADTPLSRLLAAKAGGGGAARPIDTRPDALAAEILAGGCDDGN